MANFDTFKLGPEVTLYYNDGSFSTLVKVIFTNNPRVYYFNVDLPLEMKCSHMILQVLRVLWRQFTQMENSHDSSEDQLHDARLVLDGIRYVLRRRIIHNREYIMQDSIGQNEDFVKNDDPRIEIIRKQWKKPIEVNEIEDSGWWTSFNGNQVRYNGDGTITKRDINRDETSFRQEQHNEQHNDNNPFKFGGTANIRSNNPFAGNAPIATMDEDRGKKKKR